MKMHVGLCAALLGGLLAAGPAMALEPLALYDSFSSTVLDPTKWREGERIRTIKAGMLNLAQRDWGLTSSDTGTVAQTWNEEFANSGRVTQFRTKITVNSLHITGCAANPTPAEMRARAVHVFFNTGNPAPGSQLGDVLVQTRVVRQSNSTTPTGSMRVEGLAVVCTASDCASSTVIGPIVSLGAVMVGTPVEVSVEWNKPLRKFVFVRDGGASIAEVPYTVSDVAGPGRPFQAVGTRTTLPHCASGPQVTGSIDASFDNVYVNRTAKP